MTIKRLIITMLTSCLLLTLSGHSSADSLQAGGSTNLYSSFDLQAAINAAQPGAVIQVPPGLYQGNFLIEKPLTLEGIDWPILDGKAQGHVIQVNQAPHVTLRGLVIRNTGTRLDKEEAGISANKSPYLLVENNRLENTLFGIDVKDSAESRIAYNMIGAKEDLEVAARGDSIRLWYSQNSQLVGNQISHGRDVVLWYNNGAVIRDNVITHNRYGLHFMYCDDNLVENNRLEANSVGAFLMYSRRLTLRHNNFANNRGPSGYGIGLKDLDGVEATHNLFSGNRVGMYFDNSPWSIDVSQHFSHNLFAHNDIGLLFTPSVKRNYFSQNSFIDNLEQVGLTGSGDFKGNGFTVEGKGNFWSDYTGYDANNDGLGDLPYLSKSLFENMMDKNPELRLFQFSPAQQAIQLAAVAFPIFQPHPKFSDEAPLIRPVIPTVALPPVEADASFWLMSLSLLLIASLTVGAGVFIGRAKARRTGLLRSDHRGGRPMIKVTNLTKKFNNFIAIDNLSFEVAPGEAIALWGPNGAGKTTIIRSLLGLLAAEGELYINGFNAQKQGKKARAAVGYVPQELAFYDDLTAQDTLAFYAKLKGVSSLRIDQALAEVGLSAHGHKAVDALSGGMKQRLALAIALLADPPLLILDEPTSNLDTAARDDFIKLLLRQKVQGKTLLFTSHRVEEVEALASRVLVLQEGKLKLLCETPVELAAQLGLSLSLKLMMPVDLYDNALRLLHAQGFTASRNGVGVRVRVSPSAKMAPLQTLLAGNIEVNNFEIESNE